MLKKVISVCLLALMMTSCASQPPEVLTNENLILKLPFPGENWPTHPSGRSGPSETVWRKGKNEQKESIRVAISLSRVTYPHAVRSVTDSYLKQHCEKFTSVINDDQKENGYYSLTWSVTCERKNFYSYSIHKVTTGNDSTYMTEKTWYGEPTEEDLKVWHEFMASVFVCDMRKTEHPCPEGYVRVNQ